MSIPQIQLAVVFPRDATPEPVFQAAPAHTAPTLVVGAPLVPPAARPAPDHPTLGSFARRAALGIAIFVVVVTGAACLLYAAIDRDADGIELRDVDPGPLKGAHQAPTLPATAVRSR